MLRSPPQHALTLSHVLMCANAVQVHAFNTLRVVFNDSNMAMDSSGHHAEGVMVAINGMTAPAWEVRVGCVSRSVNRRQLATNRFPTGTVSMKWHDAVPMLWQVLMNRQCVYDAWSMLFARTTDWLSLQVPPIVNARMCAAMVVVVLLWMVCGGLWEASYCMHALVFRGLTSACVVLCRCVMLQL